jgi:hypothetical protein
MRLFSRSFFLRSLFVVLITMSIGMLCLKSFSWAQASANPTYVVKVSVYDGIVDVYEKLDGFLHILTRGQYGDFGTRGEFTKGGLIPLDKVREVLNRLGFDFSDDPGKVSSDGENFEAEIQKITKQVGADSQTPSDKPQDTTGPGCGP